MKYNSPNKRQYRRTIHRYEDDNCVYSSCPNFDLMSKSLPIKPPSERLIAYLESARCEETKFLVKSKGYHPTQLYPICDSPAVQAWIVMNAQRAGIYGLNVANGPVENVLLEYAKKGIFFDCLNLDFTGCLSSPMLGCLRKIAAVLKTYSVVSITVLRGREEQSFWKREFGENREALSAVAHDQKRWMRDHGVEYGLTDLDAVRLDSLLCAFLEIRDGRASGGWIFGSPRYGIYGSESGQSMLFLQGVLLHHQNASFICDYAKRHPADRIKILEEIPENEHRHLKIYAHHRSKRLEFCGLFK